MTSTSTPARPAGEDPIVGPRLRLLLVPKEILEAVAAAQQSVRRHPSGQSPPAPDAAAVGEREEAAAVTGPATRAAPGPATPSVDWAGVGTIDPELVATMPATRRLIQLGEDATAGPWLVRIAVVADDTTPTGMRVVGHLGGHGPPDDDGMVEVGYTVATAERRQGFATEGARLWFGWAHERGARRARLSTTPDNQASRGVARRLGLPETGGTWDEDDRCWELVHEGPLPLIP